MAKKSTTDTCCLTLPLIVEKWQSDRLEKRFECARQIYNTLLRYELKKLRKLEESEEYKTVLEQIARIKEEKGENAKKELKPLYDTLNKLRSDDGFSEYGFITDVKPFYKHFKSNIGSSVAVHGIAPQVWKAFEKYFFGNGKKIHFKKRGEISSLRGYSIAGKSGGVEIIFKGTQIKWKDLTLRIKLDPDNAYETEMLRNRIKYCRIIKKPGKNKPHWYVQLSLEGKPTVKCDKETGEVLHPVGKGAVGIDIGPRTIAIASENEVSLLELADKVQNIEREKALLQRKLDRSRRATNPDNYNPDGTFKRGVKLTRNKSKRYIKNQQKLAFLQHKQADIRKRQHNELANHLMTLGDRFYVEDMNWQGLAKRAQKTEISEKTGRYKKKKRFGRSVGNKAPAMLIELLKQKLTSRGYENGLAKVPTSLRASQYNHVTDEYVKKELSERWNVMPDGRKIQRDIYSAFLLQHLSGDGTDFDRKALEKDYEKFVLLHDAEIERIRKTPKTIASMGIVRRAG